MVDRTPPSKRKIFLLVLACIALLPLLIPERAVIPVQKATSKDWNRQSFWHGPWGASGVHKGIDIFAPTGRPVVAPVHGIVIFKGQLKLGGKVVAVLGPKWRMHYFAHLNAADVHVLQLLRKGEVLGEVGTTGNAAGKAPHLHYAILSPWPRIWKASTGT